MSRIKINEFSGFRGELIFGTGRHLVEYVNPFGIKSFRTEFEKILYRNHNIIPIGGYQFVFDKLFNIGIDKESTLRVGHLNDEAPQMKIGVPRADYKSIYYNAETGVNNSVAVDVNGGVEIPALDYVFGFMIGDGGCKEDNTTPIAPNYRDRNLFHPIPFRMSNDGFTLPEDKYYGKSVSVSNPDMDPITSYYVKKFDTPSPHIVHAYVTDSSGELETVDDSVFSSTTTSEIESYVEINLSISNADARGYFTATDTTPKINEFALVHGWYNAIAKDYENLQIFTKFTRPSINLAGEGDNLDAIYRIYSI